MASGSGVAARGTGAAAVLAALALFVPTAAPAQEGTKVDPPSGQESPSSSTQPSARGLTTPPSQTVPPPGYHLSAQQAIEIAVSSEQTRKYLHGTFVPVAYLKGPGRWQVNLLREGVVVSSLVVDDQSGTIVKARTPHVLDFDARYYWIPLMALFILPFVDPRRPFRLLHLDLLVLLAFALSHLFFNRREFDTSVPLIYPVLVYLMVRMLLFVYRRGFTNEDKPVRPLVPVRYLVIGLSLLAVGHVIVNVTTRDNVMDVGYASVVGADRLTHGEGLYGNFPADDDPGQGCCISKGDTYGPVTYLAYVPFELVFPSHGVWDELPAAHAAALFFDFATMLGLFLVGRRMQRGRRGRELGVMLAFAWAAYPYTWFNLTLSANDSLVSMLLVYSFLALQSAPARGAMLALAGFTKLAPLALAPLYLSYSTHRKAAIRFVVAFAAVSFLVLLWPVLVKSSPSEFWERTIELQLGRTSPYSIWGREPSLEWLQDIVKVLAIGLAFFVAFVPRRKSSLQIAALGAAVLIASQIAVTGWLYGYIIWFVPFVLIALIGDEPQPERPGSPRGRRPEGADSLSGQEQTTPTAPAAWR